MGEIFRLHEFRFDEFNTVMQFLALKDQCQHLAGKGYSVEFCIQVMPELEELIHNNLHYGKVFDFWVKQTKTTKGEKNK